MGSKCILISVIITALASVTIAERILFVTPIGSKSHVNVFEPLMRALGERGHEVVALSPITSSSMPATVKQIQLITVDDFLGKMPNPFEQRKKSVAAQFFNTSSFAHWTEACQKVLKSPKLYSEVLPLKFDLVIFNILSNACILGLLPHFGAPAIYMTTLGAPSSMSNFVGNRLSPAFVPSVFLQYSDKMAFHERLINTMFEFVFSLMWDLMGGRLETMYREHLPNGDKLPGLNEIHANASMLFMNSHFTLTYPRPLLPNVIEVGGMHTRPAKKLPKDLDEFLTGSGDNGFIFFSLGSIVKPTQMPESTRKIFVNVFSKLKQRVLWKWDETVKPMNDLPENVKLGKWLPQQDILGHPNVRIFMTHGGLLSTQESVYHGVPCLGMPVFADQDLNVKQAENSGYAKFVEILDITEEKLETAITELINNPIYAQKAKKLSQLVRDVPKTPLDTAVYWTEYVIRHKGAPHLYSGARDLNFFQYYLLDVTAAILAVVSLFIFVSVKFFKGILGWCFEKTSSKKVHLKNE